MDSRQIRNLTEAYAEMYAPQETDWQEVYDNLLEMCMLDEDFESDTEREDFVEWIIAEGREEEFVEAIFEDYGIDLETLNEELLDERVGALLRGGRFVINALSRAGRSKAGLQKATALGKKVETIVRGAPASSSIRAARAARTPYTPPTAGRPLAAQQLKKSADVSGATRQLPGSGGTSAGSVKATTQRGTTRHNQAMGQVNTFMSGLKRMFRQGAAQTKLDKAARGTTGTGVRTGTTTPIKGQLPPSPKVTTPKSSGGLIGTRDVPNIAQVSKKYGMDVPAPKPAFGPGAVGADKLPPLPKPPKAPGRITTTKSSALGSPDLSVQRARVRVIDPMAGRKLPSGSENLNVGRMARRAAVAGATAAVAGSAGSDENRSKASTPPAATPPKASTPPATTPAATPAATPPKASTPPAATPPKASTPPAATPPKASTPPAGGGTKVTAPTVVTTPSRGSSKQTGDKKKDTKTWADANPRLAKVAELRKKGASRAEINMAMYDKGTKPYEDAKKQLGK